MKYYVEMEFLALPNYQAKLFHKKITYKKNIFQIPSEFWKIINRAKTFSEKNGSKFYFVYIPDKSRYTHNLQNDFE